MIKRFDTAGYCRISMDKKLDQGCSGRTFDQRRGYQATGQEFGAVPTDDIKQAGGAGPRLRCYMAILASIQSGQTR